MRESLEHFGSKGISPSLSFIHTVKLQCWATKVKLPLAIYCFVAIFCNTGGRGAGMFSFSERAAQSAKPLNCTRVKPLRNSALRLRSTRSHGAMWARSWQGLALCPCRHRYRRLHARLRPRRLLAKYAGPGVWYAVPLAVLIGVPLYSNAAGVIPIVKVLMEKGMAMGTSLAFMMAVTALSLPEAIILRKVLASSVCGSLSWPLREARQGKLRSLPDSMQSMK